jgi:tRNA A37 methylthiotransferase MiaB
LRGIEKDRNENDILSEVKALVDQGVIEITLLGQNVNAYGVILAIARPLPNCFASVEKLMD